MVETARVTFQNADYSPTRTEVLKKVGENQWDKIWFSKIKKGDVVKLRDPDLPWVADEDGQIEYTAKSDAYVDSVGMLCFDL